MNKEKRNARERAHYKINSKKIIAHIKLYRKAHPEWARATSQKYYKTHSKKIKADNKTYYFAHHEKTKARHRIYQQTHSEKVKAYQKAHYAANRNRERFKKNLYSKTHKNEARLRMKTYKQTNPEKFNEQRRLASRKHRVLKRGIYHEHYTDSYVFLRDNWICGICGRKINRQLKTPHPLSPSIDHIIPLSKGGNDNPLNVQAAHLGCNLGKSAKNIGQLRLFG